MYRYPLVIKHSYGKSPCLMGKLTISMVMFNSYFHITKLVSGFNPSEKYAYVSWDDDIPKCFWKNNPVMFQSPPISRG